MDALPSSMLDALQRIAGRMDSLAGSLQEKGGVSRAATSTSAELLRELKSMRSELLSLKASHESDAAGSGASVAELRRLSEAYTAAVRELRTSKSEWADKEKEWTAQIVSLKRQAAESEKHRKEHVSLTAALQQSKKQVEAANAAAETLRERLDERTKARDSASVATTSLQAQLANMSKELETARSAVSELVLLKAEHARVSRDLQLGLEQIRVITTEKDALLDTVADLQQRVQGMDATTKHALASETDVRDLAQQLRSVTSKLGGIAKEKERLAEELAVVRGELQHQRGLNDQLSLKAAGMEECQSVQVELLRTISEQAVDISSLRKALQGLEADRAEAEGRFTADARTIERLQHIVSNYQSLESEFARRTGQGFWGIFGIASDIALRPTYEAGTAHGGRGDLDISDSLKRFKDSFRCEVAGEVEGRHRAAVEKHVAAAHKLEAELQVAQGQIQALQEEKAELSSVSAALTTVERTVADLINTTCKDKDKGQDTPLVALEWHLSPAFSEVFPNVSAAIGRLKATLSYECRRRHMSEGEVMDLREEIRILRNTAEVSASQRSVNAEELRRVVRGVEAEREELRCQVTSERTKVDAYVVRLQQAEERIQRYKDRVLRARELLHESASCRVALLTMVEEHKHEAAACKAQEVFLRQQLVDAADVNQKALAQLAERDGVIQRMRAAQLCLPSSTNTDYGAMTVTYTTPAGQGREQKVAVGAGTTSERKAAEQGSKDAGAVERREERRGERMGREGHARKATSNHPSVVTSQPAAIESALLRPSELGSRPSRVVEKRGEERKPSSFLSSPSSYSMSSHTVSKPEDSSDEHSLSLSEPSPVRQAACKSVRASPEWSAEVKRGTGTPHHQTIRPASDKKKTRKK